MNVSVQSQLTELVTQSMMPGNLADAAIDYADIGLNQLLDLLLKGALPELVRELPIVKGIAAVGHAAYNVHQLFSLKKLLVFLQTVSEGNPDRREVARRIEASKNNEKWIDREVERLIIYLERHTSEQKARMQGLIYIDYLSQRFPWKKCVEYFDILDQLFLCDISQIVEYKRFEMESASTSSPEAKAPAPEAETVIAIKAEAYYMIFDMTKCWRLLSTGLLLEKTRVQRENRSFVEYELSPQGSYFAKLAMELNYPSVSEENNTSR